MANSPIGMATCPLCNSGKARAGVSASGLAYLTCNACNSQLFGRSARSDELIRRLIRSPITPPPQPAAGNAPPPPAAAGIAPPPQPPDADRKRNKWEVF